MITLKLTEQGKTLRFLGEPDPAADSVEFECTLDPGRAGPEPHVHPLQTETFRVTAGKMLAVVDGEEHLIPTGESIVIPPGKVHTFSNPDPAVPLDLRITMEPALNFQWFMMEVTRSGIRHGGSLKKAPLLEMAYILNQVIDEHEFPGMPPFVKRLLFGTLARMALALKKTGEIAPLSRHPTAARPRGDLAFPPDP